MRTRATRLATALATSGTCVLLEPGLAWARPSARFVVDAEPAATSCLSGATVRDAVAERLGYDPFVGDARASVHATFSKQAGGWAATVRVSDANGALLGERRLTSKAATCRELVDAVALSIGVALDHGGPLDAPPMTKDPVVPAPPVPTPDTRGEDPFAALDATQAMPVPVAEDSASGWSTAIKPLVGVGTSVAFGSAPAVAIGFAFEAGLTQRSWSVALEGRADLPASASGAAPGARTSLAVGSLVPCVRVKPLEACAVVSVGALFAEGLRVPVPKREEALYVTFGARAALAVPFVRAWAFVPFAEIATPLTRPALTLDNRAVWSPPAVAGTLGIRLRVVFP